MKWFQLYQAPFKEVIDWAAEQPWCQAMADCQQDAGWHSEGDVWTHTKMVCAQLRELDEWPSLNRHEHKVLLFTALFHDAAKPLTTQVDPETGRTTSPKHAVKGEALARSVLRGLDCELSTREEIARLVRFHGRPAFLLEKPDANREVISLSWLVSNKLLYLFALADTRGRTTSEMSRPEENVMLWKITAEESDCFDQPYPFANDHARFTFYRQPDFDLHYVPHEEYTCTVTMMSGLPGSGKDTWLAQNACDVDVVSLDDMRTELNVSATENQGEVIQHARERCREHLRAKTSFAFNATNLVRHTRKRWIDLFADYGARIEIVYTEAVYDLILQQNKNREAAVPEAVIHELAQKCEPPTWTEGHHLLYVENSRR